MNGEDILEMWISSLRQMCGYDPVPLEGTPMGMLHCPECGCMILAGQPHPPCDPNECGAADEPT